MEGNDGIGRGGEESKAVESCRVERSSLPANQSKTQSDAQLPYMGR